MDLDALLSRITREMVEGDGAGVRVAVVDGGVGGDAPAVRGRLVESVLVRESGRGEDGKARFRVEPDRNGAGAIHGTVVAGIILKAAPRADVVSVNVAGPGREAGAEAIIEAIRWAVGAKCGVVNISLGVVRGEVIAARRMALAEAVEEAYWKGAVVVAAAHPDHPGTLAMPATFAVPVSAHHRLDAAERPFRYALEGNVEFAAPGATDVAGRIETSAGFAAPHLAGYACRIRGRYPDLKPFEVKTVLYRLAEHYRRQGGRPT